jgi:hypothetical protein
MNAYLHTLYTYIYMYIYIYIYMYLYLYIYIYVYAYLCICIYYPMYVYDIHVLKHRTGPPPPGQAEGLMEITGEIVTKVPSYVPIFVYHMYVYIHMYMCV